MVYKYLGRYLLDCVLAKLVARVQLKHLGAEALLEVPAQLAICSTIPVVEQLCMLFVGSDD